MGWLETCWSAESALWQWGVVLTAALIAAWHDFRTRRIPNRLTGPLVVSGLVWAGVVGGLAGLGESLAATVILAAPFFLMFAFNVGGAGDAKLMAGLGAWLGIQQGLITLVAVMVAGAVMGLVYAVCRQRARAVLANLVGIVRGLYAGFLFVAVGHGRTDAAAAFLPDGHDYLKMPYGIAIFLGVCLAAIYTCLLHPYLTEVLI